MALVKTIVSESDYEAVVSIIVTGDSDTTTTLSLTSDLRNASEDALVQVSQVYWSIKSDQSWKLSWEADGTADTDFLFMNEVGPQVPLGPFPNTVGDLYRTGNIVLSPASANGANDTVSVILKLAKVQGFERQQ